MITCNLMGGLGNQLFQIFATISYAIKSRNLFKFTNATTIGRGATTVRNTYWNSFFSRLKHFTTDVFPPQLHIIRETDFTFHELPINEMVDNNVIISGYFQSYKYFESNYEIICRMIDIEQMKRALLYKLHYTSLENTVSMHFRIGDYKPIQHFHPIMTKEYYTRCLYHIQSKNSDTIFTIMYFCEDVDLKEVEEKIEYLSKEFPNYTFIRGNNTLEDWEQMLLMSCCRHNIIANSSFSWWSAYFNRWDEKIVCYPSVWFGSCVRNDTKDLCPPEWIQIDAF
jgi:hypothetical protein